MSTIAAWRARMASAPVADPERLVGTGALVVLAPHPDDETIGCSALILEAVRLGRAVGIVALTDGEGSHRGSADYPPQRLGAIRRAEQEAAVARLGCQDVHWLRLGLPDGASGRSQRLAEAVEAISALCDRLGATVLAAPHPDDPHPDHHTAAALARAVRDRRPGSRLLNYEVWSRRLSGDEPFRDAELTPFRLRSDARVKRAALDEHASQLGRLIEDDPDGFSLPPWFLDAMDEPFEPMSWSAMPGEVPGPEHFSRLYAEDGDPWHVRSSHYEREKRETAIAGLAGRRYARSLEAGCGEGHLTGALLSAGIAAQAVGLDRDASIVQRARSMGFGTQASFVTGSLPDDLPDGPFDLVIFSEVLYFLRENELAALAANLAPRLAPDASLLLVSYKGPTGTPLGGLDAADVFVACLGEAVTAISSHEAPRYRMELLRWRPAPRPAPAAGGEGPTGEGEGGQEPG